MWQAIAVGQEVLHLELEAVGARGVRGRVSVWDWR